MPCLKSLKVHGPSQQTYSNTKMPENQIKDMKFLSNYMKEKKTKKKSKKKEENLHEINPSGSHLGDHGQFITECL